MRVVQVKLGILILRSARSDATVLMRCKAASAGVAIQVGLVAIRRGGRRRVLVECVANKDAKVVRSLYDGVMLGQLVVGVSDDNS